MRIAVSVLACLLASGALPAQARQAAPAGVAPAPAASEAPTCRKLPAGKRLVKLNLKPDTEIADLVAWISSVTCKSFVLPGGIADGKRITVVSPRLITVGEAYALFVEALGTVGLTVYPAGRYLRVVETAKAKSSPIPLVIPGELDGPAAGP